MTDRQWHAAFTEWFSHLEHGAAVAVVLPAYRPDLVEVLARHLGFAFVDFRKERLAPLGWQAGRQPLADISDCAADAMVRHGKGVVVHNAEALLATQDSAMRKAWFAEVLNRRWTHHLVIPVVLYSFDLPPGSSSVFTFTQAGIPEESLLEWLPSLR